MFLLTIGLLSAILPIVEMFTIDLWLSQTTQEMHASFDHPAIYDIGLISFHVFLLLPIVMDFWSIAWAMEDAGLMHYKFDDRKGYELYEIEPIFIKYSSFIKGFAGISSIVFIIQVVLGFAAVTEESRIMDIINIIITPISIIVLAIPAYLVYYKVGGNHEYLRKGLEPIKILDESQIKS